MYVNENQVQALQVPLGIQKEDNQNNSLFLHNLMSALENTALKMSSLTDGVELKEEDKVAKMISPSKNDLGDLILTLDMLQSDEVQSLLRLLPDYVRENIEDLFQNQELLNIQDREHTLVELMAILIGYTNLFQYNREEMNNESIEQIRNKLHFGLKAEAQITGVNLSEIFSKLDKLMNRSQETKHDYFNGLLHRLTVPKLPLEQRGMNITNPQESFQPINRTQQLLIHIGEQPTNEAEQRQFIRQFQDILGKRLLRQFNNGNSQLTIKLFPQHLGRLDIQFVQLNGAITAKIIATTAAAKEILEGQIQQLRIALAQQQLNVEKVEIYQQQQQSNNQLHKDGQNNQQSHSKNHSRHGEGEMSNESFSEVLEGISISESIINQKV